jgi:hypothetical protein
MIPSSLPPILGGGASAVANVFPIGQPMDQFDVGDGVQLRGQPRYLKTADAMPMLRPPDLVDPDEVGEVTAIKAGNQVAVRFRRGTFLFELNQLLPTP